MKKELILHNISEYKCIIVVIIKNMKTFMHISGNFIREEKLINQVRGSHRDTTTACHELLMCDGIHLKKQR